MSDIITNEAFTALLIRNARGSMRSKNKNKYAEYMRYALGKGIITESENEQPQNALTRKNAARIAHEVLLKLYGEADSAGWTAAEALADLYDCHTCVMHIAQMYVKGIMSGRGDGLFHGSDLIGRSEAVQTASRIRDASLRVPPRSTCNEENTITVETALEMAKNGAVIADVRPADEYAAWHIEGSISIPMENFLPKPTAFEIFERSSAVIFCCKRGTNSKRAARILSEAGFEHVFDMGGIEALMAQKQ